MPGALYLGGVMTGYLQNDMQRIDTVHGFKHLKLSDKLLIDLTNSPSMSLISQAFSNCRVSCHHLTSKVPVTHLRVITS